MLKIQTGINGYALNILTITRTVIKTPQQEPSSREGEPFAAIGRPICIDAHLVPQQ